jgi:hypothetical protein
MDRQPASSRRGGVEDGLLEAALDAETLTPETTSPLRSRGNPAVLAIPARVYWPPEWPPNPYSL